MVYTIHIHPSRRRPTSSYNKYSGSIHVRGVLARHFIEVVGLGMVGRIIHLTRTSRPACNASQKGNPLERRELMTVEFVAWVSTCLCTCCGGEYSHDDDCQSNWLL